MSQQFWQALRLGRQTFPGIWRAMMPPGFSELRFPDEKESNCSACPKICEEGWRPDYRCCTYHPRISNFLLGLALHTPEGERAVDEILQRGMVLPEGMHSSPQQWLDFLDDQQQERFGKSSKVLCPMLDPQDGRCRIHIFRNSVCSTYFCHKDQGSAGDAFWGQIQTLGTQMEMRLSQWALREIGFDVEASLQALDDLAPHVNESSTDRGWQTAALQKIWGPYWGREKELLRACADVVLAHADELWTLAQNLTIVEAHGFDQALSGLMTSEQESLLEEEEGEWQEVDLQELWADCLDAHAALWQQPEGQYTLSPNVHFKANTIEYRYQNPGQTLAFSLTISAAQKDLLLGFRDARKNVQKVADEHQDFLRDMVHRKVLWTVS